MKHRYAPAIALLSILACVAAAAIEVWPAARGVLTEDRNGDGAPDLWRRYDNRGELARVDVDSNFDGSPDIEEYYERGALVRRESDRNFNGQADLVEEFDAETHEQTRSVVDVDYDGTADLLVLFRDGRPVFSAHAAAPGDRAGSSRIASAVRPHRSGLIALIDPFESENAVRAIHVVFGEDGSVGLSTSGGLPVPRAAVVRRIPTSARLISRDFTFRPASLLLRRSPRAPPAI